MSDTDAETIFPRVKTGKTFGDINNLIIPENGGRYIAKVYGARHKDSRQTQLIKAVFNSAHDLPDEYDPVEAVKALPELIEPHEVNSALMSGEIPTAVRWCRHHGIEVPPDLNVDDWLNATERPNYTQENFSDVMTLSRRISDYALQKARKDQ